MRRVQEAIYTMIMMKEGFIAASANIENPDPAIGDIPVPSERVDGAAINLALSNLSASAAPTPPLPCGRSDATAGLLAGKRGLIMGVANERSSAGALPLRRRSRPSAFTYRWRVRQAVAAAGRVRRL